MRATPMKPWRRTGQRCLHPLREDGAAAGEFLECGCGRNRECSVCGLGYRTSPCLCDLEAGVWHADTPERFYDFGW